MQQDQAAMTRKRSRTRNRSRQRSRRRGGRQRREGKPPQQQIPPQSTAREQWARGAEMCIQTSRSLFEWHHNQVKSLCQGFRQKEASEEIPTQHCLDYVYESSSDEEEQEEEEEHIDEGYLQFLAVTIRHQEELRRRRADTTTACLDEHTDRD